jgi:uncharacterized protein (DUF608 family)
MPHSNASRRDFLKTTTAISLGLLSTPILPRALGQITPTPSLIPPDKNLSPDWLKTLFAKGSRKIYRHEELRTIGMPIGGITAGQMYLSGDGTLGCWDIFNHTPDTGPGDTRYAPLPIDHSVSQGFTLTLNGADRPLDIKGFPSVSFVGEYPLAWVTYDDDSFPLKITLEAFSPFIPLNASDSSLPATILRFELENRTGKDIDADLTGHLENAVAQYSKNSHIGTRLNRVKYDPDRNTEYPPTLTLVEMSVQPRVNDSAAQRAPEVFDDFESGYAKWTLTGAAFGDQPATGTIPPQQPVSGFQGKHLVNTFNPNDDSTGRATSIEFTLERPFINFLIGGGAIPQKTCLNLIVDGQIVRSATGRNSEHLDWQSFSVRPFIGKKAHFEIVDNSTGGWGHINVDQIEFADRPVSATSHLTDESDFGTMTLAYIGHGQSDNASADLLEPLVSKLTARLNIPAGQKQTATFILSWHFPNRPSRGQHYATRFTDSSDVARYIAVNLTRLRADTHLWHDTYYDSTLPHWLLDRLHMPVSNLATGVTQWWKNGRFWAFEGVGSCVGTCTHVWNYAQALARLFPELERSAREMQDFSAGYHDSGLVGFRGDNNYAADGQCGTVLKAYREHLMSKDDAFLKRNYPHIKKAMQYLIAHDATPPLTGRQPAPNFSNTDPHPTATPDGLIEDPQHNTYDIWFHGPNTFVGALYLAALRASTEMATLMNDPDFSTQCQSLFTSGSAWTDKNLFDGEYYFQQVNLKDHPQHQYAHGCLSDQLFGQSWANQVNLGQLYNPNNIRTALQSIYKYNWTPDIAPYSAKYPPGRWFARAGDAGLIICTFPKSEYLHNGVVYREEVWTGIEYQYASHLLSEGLLTEGLSVIRAIHNRYDGTKHNPWNEIECGDHYARSLASWSCLTALSGYQYNGPANSLSFHPKLTPENFRCPFTTAEGWGTYTQTKDTATIALKHGTLPLTNLTLPLPLTRATLNNTPLTASATTTGDGHTTLTFSNLTLSLSDILTLHTT